MGELDDWIREHVDMAGRLTQAPLFVHPGTGGRRRCGASGTGRVLGGGSLQDVRGHESTRLRLSCVARGSR